MLVIGCWVEFSRLQGTKNCVRRQGPLHLGRTGSLWELREARHFGAPKLSFWVLISNYSYLPNIWKVKLGFCCSSPVGSHALWPICHDSTRGKGPCLWTPAIFLFRLRVLESHPVLWSYFPWLWKRLLDGWFQLCFLHIVSFAAFIPCLYLTFHVSVHFLLSSPLVPSLEVWSLSLQWVLFKYIPILCLFTICLYISYQCSLRTSWT